VEQAVKIASALHFADRVPVVSIDGKPLMPCKPAKARKLMEQNKAIPRWSKFGIFYIQLLIEIKSPYNHNQSFILANDPGSNFDGFALGCKYVQLRVMAVLPTKISDKRKDKEDFSTGKMGSRANLRRGRRYRNCRRRPWRPRSHGKGYIAPSQLAKVQFRLAIIKELCKLFPITHFIVEDVKFNHYNKRNGRYFSTVEIGKTAYYSELKKLGYLILVQGYQTNLWRQEAGLKKISQKSAEVPESHANDAVAMLHGLAGIIPNPNTLFYVYRRPEFYRRSIHFQNPKKGGKRPQHGGTINGTFFRKGDYVSVVDYERVPNNTSYDIKIVTRYGWIGGLPTSRNNRVLVIDGTRKQINWFTLKWVKLIARSTNILWRKVLP